MKGIVQLGCYPSFRRKNKIFSVNPRRTVRFNVRVLFEAKTERSQGVRIKRLGVKFFNPTEAQKLAAERIRPNVDRLSSPS